MSTKQKGLLLCSRLFYGKAVETCGPYSHDYTMFKTEKEKIDASKTSISHIKFSRK